MTDERPTRVTDAELWQFRALNEALRATNLEIQLLDRKSRQLEADIELFKNEQLAKYGNARMETDGSITYFPDKPKE